jgi:hypothetical protein
MTASRKSTSPFLRALAARAGLKIAGDVFSELSEQDRENLAVYEAEWKRDGDAAFERWEERRFIDHFRIVAALNPRLMRRALEESLIDAGLTIAEIRTMLEKARTKH